MLIAVESVLLLLLTTGGTRAYVCVADRIKTHLDCSVNNRECCCLQ